MEHDPGETHPECPDRLRVISETLHGDDFHGLERREPPLGTVEQIERVHDSGYVRAVFEQVPTQGHVYLDGDTVMSPSSGQAALRAVGGICAAVDAVIEGQAHNAFCAMRPPGHHAEHDHAMGFCLFNNVAIAAHHARVVHGLQQVAVVDFDVHHGNGTQHAFYDDPALFFASSHQWPNYPGTGTLDETGALDDRGCPTNMNAHLSPGSGSDEFRAVWRDTLLPALEDFAPDLIIISAGFDAHERDPLAGLNVKTDDFYWITRQIMAVADACCRGRVVSSLEGGYDLKALGDSVAVHVKALMDH